MTIKLIDPTEIEAGDGVEVTAEPTHPPRKPDYDPMDVMREIARVENNIRSKEEAVRKEEVKRADFETWIKRHEEWEVGGEQEDKPQYNRQALQDGVIGINQNIRRIRESIETERRNIEKLERMLESYRKYQKHLEGQAALEG